MISAVQGTHTPQIAPRPAAAATEPEPGEAHDGIAISGFTYLGRLTDLLVAKSGAPIYVPPLSPETFDAVSSLSGDAVPDNDASRIWGNIEVGGRVIAQIYESGVIATRSGFDLPGGSGAESDPAARARLMVETYGGKLIERSEMDNPTLFNGV
ncbi:hypothetical protein [Sphingomonas sp. dw_22]|uniref:hypothetical protein n=1 Tax=Sphingomonas sp. dw_22 TaxID=2721175 RepID=UPI001BD442C1|nr:hypothetical protein [Sphingomonas sp. dw_22]